MRDGPLLLRLENTVFWRDGALVIIDRRSLPHATREIICRDSNDVALAIKDMAVQGAGDIAICAGYGLLLSARTCSAHAERLGILRDTAEKLSQLRPTGFHLGRFLGKILARVAAAKGDYAEIIEHLLREALEKQDAISRATGENAARLLDDGDAFLTHCFAGAGLLYMCLCAQREGKRISAICTETRPYLQGARLTAFSLAQIGLETTLITDNMAAHCLATGKANKVFVAADRIALDGSVANKIGTLAIAISANYFHVPLYVLAYGGPDKNTATASDVPIEERNPAEVLSFAGHPLSADGVKAIYPAFDVTPRELISAYITSREMIPPDAFTWKSFHAPAPPQSSTGYR